MLSRPDDEAGDRDRLGPAPPGASSSPSVAVRYAGLAAACVAAVAVAVAGSFVHRWASPFGVLLAVGGAAAVALVALVCARGRMPLILVAALWIGPVLAMTQPGPGEDLVIAGDTIGLVFLFSGFTCYALAIGAGGAAGRSRRVP